MFSEIIRKARAHKYISRRRNPNAPPKWTYKYKYTAQSYRRGVASADVQVQGYGANISVGDSFKDAHERHNGHWVVTEIDGHDITMKHDETGEEVTHSGHYSVSSFINGMHKEGLEAEKKIRLSRYSQETRRAVGVAMKENDKFNKTSSVKTLFRAANAWQRVRARATEAGWSVVQLAHEMGVGVPPKDVRNLDREIKALRPLAEVSGISLRQLAHDPAFVFTLADPAKIKNVVRLMYLQDLSKGFSQHYNYSQTEFPSEWREHKNGDHIKGYRVFAEGLVADIKGDPTPRKVLNAITRSEGVIASDIGKIDYLIFDEPYSAPYGKESDPRAVKVQEIIDEFARTRRGFIDASLPNQGNTSQEAASITERRLGRAVRNASTAVGMISGVHPEMLAGTHKIVSAEDVTRTARGFSYSSETDPLVVEAAKAQFQKMDNPVVMVAPTDLSDRGGKGAFQDRPIPLDMVVKALNAESASSLEDKRAEHAKVWSRTADVLKRIHDATAQAVKLSGGEPAWAEKMGTEDLFFATKAYRQEHKTSGYQEAYEAVSEYRRNRSSTVRQEINKALGITPDVQAAKAKIEESKPDEIRSRWSTKGEITNLRPYDLDADLGGISKLFESCALDILPQGVRLDVTSSKIRASAGYDGACFLSESSGRSSDGLDLTLIHEYGHQIEHANPKVKAACIALRNERAKGEKIQKLHDVDPNRGYDADEETYKDNWRDPYTGKWYGHSSSTEILSMGVERYVMDPVEFAHSDPQHFQLVVAILSGAFGPAEVDFTVKRGGSK